jgi:hypothetical protein
MHWGNCPQCIGIPIGKISALRISKEGPFSDIGALRPLQSLKPLESMTANVVHTKIIPEICCDWIATRLIYLPKILYFKRLGGIKRFFILNELHDDKLNLVNKFIKSVLS